MEERENILKILEGTLDAIKKNDSFRLKDLSNQTIHTASITQDPENIALAVIIYSISKIIERPMYREKEGWTKFYQGVIKEVTHSINAIKEKDEKHLKIHIEGLRDRIERVSGRLKKYIEEVFIKARINKASRIYEHGISMGKTADLLGITLWDLAGYAGQTGIGDVNLGKTMEVRNRIKIAEEIFK
ncbi:MAG TPA: hypothetical protein VJH92_03155 [Candidatus Nanoarchaeia archaeon]|nr:hypothetical protein [Candidatus Nanoarchaeia archaeon]